MIASKFGGLWGSLKCASDTVVSILKNRLELATLELKEEKSRLVSAAIFGGAFIFCAFLALISIACTLLYAFWDQRLYVAIGLLVVCLIAALIGFFAVKKGVTKPYPFSETIAQLKKDRAWLQGKN